MTEQFTLEELQHLNAAMQFFVHQGIVEEPCKRCQSCRTKLEAMIAEMKAPQKEPDYVICKKANECKADSCWHKYPHRKQDSMTQDSRLDNCDRTHKCGGNTTCEPCIKPDKPISTKEKPIIEERIIGGHKVKIEHSKV